MILFLTFPGVEAHGGYSFCGFAALVLLGEEDKIDIQKLLVSFTNVRK
jgi:protein farnesyltransferase subunit beta